MDPGDVAKELSEQQKEDSSVANSAAMEVNYEPGSQDGSIRGLGFNLSDHGSLRSGSSRHLSDFRDEASIGHLSEQQRDDSTVVKFRSRAS